LRASLRASWAARRARAAEDAVRRAVDRHPGLTGVVTAAAHVVARWAFAELGLVGFVLLLWPIWMLLRRAFSGALQQGLTLGLLAAVLGVLLHSLTDYTLLIISTAMMFSVVMGMLAVLTEPSPASSAPG